MELARRLVVLVLLVAPVIRPALATAAGKRSLVVDVAPADWRAEAVIQTLAADLADDQIAPRGAPSCGGPCSDSALRAAGVELVVRATLAAGSEARLGYELRALWPRAPVPVRGSIALGRLDRAAFAGLLRDQLHRLARTTTEDGADGSAPAGTPGADQASRPPLPATRPPEIGDLPSLATLAMTIALALGALATPFLFGAVRARRLVARSAAGRTLLGVAGLGAVALAVSALAPANSDGVLLLASGIAWGSFATVTLPVMIPPLVGIARIDYRELWRVLAAWCGLVAQRTLLLAAFYAPVALGVMLAPGTGARSVRIALGLPLVLLIARQWARLAIAVAAERLDAALADGTADAAGWQAAVRGYLVGYLRRNALPIDLALLDRLTIVPALGDEVCVYGGGATHTRLAIPRKMLELALAPWGRPHDYAAPRVSTLHWTEWNAGLVMTTEAGAVVATREQRQPHPITTESDPSDNARDHLGEPPTLAGIIEPTALDPRRSYRPHDDPAWLDWDAGEDYDGTDAGDRDFLFGVLAHAVAQIQRHGDRTSTLALVLRRAGRVTAPLGRLLDRLPDAAGDSHAAIQGARHHLLQYLGWQAWQREDLLTARAYAPELEAMSRRVLAARPPSTERASPATARSRDRLARLAGFVPGSPPVGTRWRRRLFAAAVVAGAVAAAVVAVADAVRYHATLTDRPTSPTETMEKPDHGKN